MNWQATPPVVRRVFIPKLEVFNFFDYVSIEPRIFAYFAAKLGDDTLAQWFREGRDVYCEVAGRVKKPSVEVTEEERKLGKVLFLMSLYGAGPKAIAKKTGMQDEEARDFYRTFHEALPQIRMLSNPRPRRANVPWVPGAIERVLSKRGYLKDPWARHLHPEQFGEYKLLNKLIQSSAADLLKDSILRVDDWLQDNPDVESHLVNVIHDELMFDGLESEIELLHEAIPLLMREERLQEVVPIEVDHEVSVTNWAEKVSFEQWRSSREEVAA
jgi:DNA polymerase-1